MENGDKIEDYQTFNILYLFLSKGDNLQIFKNLINLKVIFELVSSGISFLAFLCNTIMAREVPAMFWCFKLWMWHQSLAQHDWGGSQGCAVREQKKSKTAVLKILIKMNLMKMSVRYLFMWHMFSMIPMTFAGRMKSYSPT